MSRDAGLGWGLKPGRDVLFDMFWVSGSASEI